MGYYVYIHTCKANNKKYVGVTGRNPESRWGKNGEGYLYNDHFRSAILKHGWDNFEHEVFEVDSKEEMYRKEVELISFYHSNDPEFGYNNSSGGEYSHLGCKHSEEFRKKRSEDNLKRCLDPEYRKKLSESHKGKPLSEETKRKISEARKGKPHSKEVRKHISEGNKKRWTDPEYRRKQAEAAKNRPKPRRVKIKLPDGTIVEITKQNLARDYINKGRKFEYVD